MKKAAKLAVAAVLSVGLIGGIVGTSLAADPSPTTTPQARQWQPGPGNAAGARYGAGFGAQALSGPIAEALGLSVAQIQAERLSGKSLVEIGSAQGVSEQQLIDLMVASRKQLLDQRVASGTLTQAQADAALSQMQFRVNESIHRTEVGPNPQASPLGLGLRWGRAGQSGQGSGYGQPGLGTGPGLGRRYGAGAS